MTHHIPLLRINKCFLCVIDSEKGRLKKNNNRRILPRHFRVRNNVFEITTMEQEFLPMRVQFTLPPI